MKITLSLVMVALLAFAIPALADNPERIGVVSALQGSASARNGSSAARPLAVRQPIYRNDVITSGAGSRCVLLFADMTTFCLGANSTLRVQQYIAGRAAQFELQRGTFQMMSGDIARTNPTQFNMSTPTASIGIRGTTTGHVIGEGGEKHYVLDMEPGHQVIIDGLRNNNHVVIDHDLISVELNPQGGFGAQIQLTPGEALEFTGQFEINDPRAYMPPPLDANGNPILPPLFDENGNPIVPPMFDANGNPIAPMPMYDAEGNPIAPMPMYDAEGNPVVPMPMYDANGNPIAPMPMYDAEGNPIAPPPGYSPDGTLFPTDDATMFATLEYTPMAVTYDANGNVVLVPLVYDAAGNLLPPPPMYDAAGNLLPPPPMYDAAGNPLPPPPMYDAAGNLISGTEFMYDPTGNYIPPPDIFDPYADYYTGDQIVSGGTYYYYPTHMTAVMMLYNATGGSNLLTPGGIYKTGIIADVGPPTFTAPGGYTVTGGDAGGPCITSVSAFASPTPYTGWTGTEYVYRNLYGAYYLPGTSNQYMGWGEWALSNPAALFSDVNYDLSIASAFYVDGIKTPEASLAGLTAQNVIGYYSGSAAGVYMLNGSAPQNIYGNFSSTVNFGTNQVSGTLLEFPSDGISLQQSATPVTLSPLGNFNISVMSTGGTTTMPVAGAAGSGNISGACFGPNAEGVGGTFDASGSNEIATGVFAGER